MSHRSLSTCEIRIPKKNVAAREHREIHDAEQTKKIQPITFSFLLVEMITNFRNRFGNRYCQNFSISRMSMNSCALFLILRNGSPCVEGCLVWNKAIGPAQVSVVPGSAQVFLGAMWLPFLLILEGFQTIHCWTSRLFCEYEFRSQSPQFLWISRHETCFLGLKLIESQLLTIPHTSRIFTIGFRMKLKSRHRGVISPHPSSPSGRSL